MRVYVNVKLAQVNFVPTWHEVDEAGGVHERTLVGQAAVDAGALPEELQRALEQLILQGLNEWAGKE